MPLKPKKHQKHTSVIPTKKGLQNSKVLKVKIQVYQWYNAKKKTSSSQRQCKQSKSKIMPINNKGRTPQPACPFYGH